MPPDDLQQIFHGIDNVGEQPKQTSDILPNKCSKCVNSTICSPLNTFISLLQIGIKVQIQQCPYHANE